MIAFSICPNSNFIIIFVQLKKYKLNKIYIQTHFTLFHVIYSSYIYSLCFKVLCHLPSHEDGLPGENHSSRGRHDRHLDPRPCSILPIPGHPTTGPPSERNRGGTRVEDGKCLRWALRTTRAGRGPYSHSIHCLLLCSNRSDVLCIRENCPQIVDPETYRGLPWPCKVSATKEENHSNADSHCSGISSVLVAVLCGSHLPFLQYCRIQRFPLGGAHCSGHRVHEFGGESNHLWIHEPEIQADFS